MAERQMAIPELYHAGVEALIERLGPADAYRFLHLFHAGHGDYTKERHQWLDKLTMDDIVRGIEQSRQ